MEKRMAPILTPGPGRKRARAAAENAEAEEAKVELEEIDSLKKVSSYSSTSYEDSLSSKTSPVKCINYVEDDTNSLLKTPSPVKCINSDEDDMTSIFKTPSPVKCINSGEDDMTSMFKTPSPVKCINTTPSSHPIRRLPRKVVIVPSKRKPLTFILQAIREKERLASMERCRKMIAGLPELFNRIHLLFQSIGCPVLTKEELIQKLYIVDTKEVEEQLKLLQELAPEWIYEKLELSGDSLICVNKILSPEAVHTRLSEAI